MTDARDELRTLLRNMLKEQKQAVRLLENNDLSDKEQRGYLAALAKTLMSLQELQALIVTNLPACAGNRVACQRKD